MTGRDSLVYSANFSKKTRGLDVDIDVDFVRSLWDKQGGLCYWFGVPMVPSTATRDPQRPSIERLDCSGGYTRGNVVLACMAANLGRSNCSAERFSEFCALVRASARAV